VFEVWGDVEIRMKTTMKQLEAKIAELEKRIAMLEARPIVYPRSEYETLHPKWAPPIQHPPAGPFDHWPKIICSARNPTPAELASGNYTP